MTGPPRAPSIDVGWIGPIAAARPPLGRDAEARLARHLGADPAVAVRPRHRAILGLVLAGILAAALHEVAARGFLPAAGASRGNLGSNAGTTPMDARRTFVSGIFGAAVLAGPAVAQDAVQWRVEDGGNGHWYAVMREADGFDALTAASRALSFGAHLFTGCSVEFDHAVESTGALDPIGWLAWGNHRLGPWIGLYRSADVFVWLDDTSCTFDRWDTEDSQPNNGGEDAVMLYSTTPEVGTRCHDVGGSRLTRSALIEWSADCNGDGIVDYGQIRAGELDDADADNVPDCCERGSPCGCAADVDASGAVNAIDLAVILSNWGTDGGKYPGADVDRSGTVDAVDLAEVLNGWGPCD